MGMGMCMSMCPSHSALVGATWVLNWRYMTCLLGLLFLLWSFHA